MSGRLNEKQKEKFRASLITIYSMKIKNDEELNKIVEKELSYIERYFDSEGYSENPDEYNLYLFLIDDLIFMLNKKGKDKLMEMAEGEVVAIRSLGKNSKIYVFDKPFVEWPDDLDDEYHRRYIIYFNRYEGFHVYDECTIHENWDVTYGKRLD